MRTLLALALPCAFAVSAAGGGDFTIAREKGAVLIRNQSGVPVLGYQLERPQNTRLSVESACYFHPVATSSGVVITDVAPTDHLHHRGIFLAWVEMHGAKEADFWGWGEHAPKKGRAIVNREVSGLSAVRDRAAFRARNEWLAEGTPVMHETLEAEIRKQGDVHVLDLTYTLTPAADTTLARWAFSGFCVRTRKDGKIEAFGPAGLVTLPNPKHTEPESDWPDAAWYDYTLTLEAGKTAGVAVMNHPKNPPTLWHNERNTRMLNPSIVAPGSVQMKAGQPMVLRYRVVVHDGPAPRELLSRLKFE